MSGAASVTVADAGTVANSASASTTAADTASTSANPARGEVSLEVGGQSMTVRPSFAALVAAEQQVGPLFALVETAAAGKLTLKDAVGLIFYCLVDRPQDLTREALGEQIAEAGISVLSPVLRGLLQQILKGR